MTPPKLSPVAEVIGLVLLDRTPDVLTADRMDALRDELAAEVTTIAVQETAREFWEALGPEARAVVYDRLGGEATPATAAKLLLAEGGKHPAFGPGGKAVSLPGVGTEIASLRAEVERLEAGTRGFIAAMARDSARIAEIETELVGLREAARRVKREAEVAGHLKHDFVLALRDLDAALQSSATLGARVIAEAEERGRKEGSAVARDFWGAKHDAAVLAGYKALSEQAASHVAAIEELQKLVASVSYLVVLVSPVLESTQGYRKAEINSARNALADAVASANKLLKG